MDHTNDSSRYQVGKLLLNSEYYDALNTYQADIPFYCDIIKRYARKGKVLELGCGTGRVTIPLAKLGFDITALDASSSMLKGAIKKATKEQLKINFTKQNMKNFTFNSKFDVILIPFNSLQNIYLLNDITMVFQSIKKHLNKGGILAFDISSPNIYSIVQMERQKKKKKIGKFKLHNGEIISLSESSYYDSIGQVERITWYYSFNNGHEITQKLDMRCYYPQEMDALLTYNGFNLLKKYGDFNKNIFSESSSNQIYICRL